MKRDEFLPLAIPKAWTRSMLAIAMSGLLAGCGGGSMFGSSSGASAPAASSPSIGDRFGQLFGSKSQAVGEAAPAQQADEPTCPQVAIRFGTSTLAVGLPGKPASGTDLRYQASIIRTARDCALVAGQVKARIGIQGRVIVGPAGAPPSVDVPMRIAVVKEGISPKVIFTKAVRTAVDIPTDASYADFSIVVEDVFYPVPPGDDGDSYVFYIGFDPEGLKPEPRAKGGKPVKKRTEG